MVNCNNQKVSLASTGKLHSFSIDGTVFKFSDRMSEVEDYWKEFAYEDIFLSPAFLKVIENATELGIRPVYVLEMRGRECVGVYYFQMKYFSLKEALSKKDSEPGKLKSMLQGWVRFNTLVFGNLLLTGNYGCRRKESGPKQLDWPKFQQGLLAALQAYYHFEPSAILAKDYCNPEIPKSLEESGFTTFSVQPNMIFQIQENWRSMDDYLEDLKAKYRVRYRRALKKMGNYIFREMTVTDLEVYQSQIHRLYKNIAEGASFNLFNLPEDYFLKMKLAMPSEFIVLGCYDSQGKLLAFFSCVNNVDHLQAHFLGYDPDMNEAHQLYLNMLYKMIEIGIVLRHEKIIMSRTAIEIKSSVGAVPEEMSCMFIHTNSLANKFFSPLFSLFNPEETYILRSPFKKAGEEVSEN